MFRFAIAMLALLFWTSTVFAGPPDAFGKSLVAKIKSEGYRIESVRTTWLRRIEIDSRSARSKRQTVYNPVTSVVLQDLIIPIDQDSLMTKVSEIFGLDLRSNRKGRSKSGTSIVKSAASTPGNGNSKGKSGKDHSGKGNSGNGNSGNGNSGNGNSGKGNSGNGNSGKGSPGKGKNK